MKSHVPMITVSWSESITMAEEFAFFSLFFTADWGFKENNKAAQVAWYKPQGLIQDSVCSLSLSLFIFQTHTVNKEQQQKNNY